MKIQKDHEGTHTHHLLKVSGETGKGDIAVQGFGEGGASLAFEEAGEIAEGIGQEVIVIDPNFEEVGRVAPLKTGRHFHALGAGLSDKDWAKIMASKPEGQA